MIWRWAIAGSFAWAITGANAGMHLAVAPAARAFQTCIEKAENPECLARLRHDWATYSGDRLSYALMVGLMPIPFVWLIGWTILVRKSAFADKGRKRVEITA
jgi:hypothetical protein